MIMYCGFIKSGNVEKKDFFRNNQPKQAHHLPYGNILYDTRTMIHRPGDWHIIMLFERPQYLIMMLKFGQPPAIR